MSWAGKAKGSFKAGMFDGRLWNFEPWQIGLKEEHKTFLQMGTTPSVVALLVAGMAFDVMGTASGDAGGDSSQAAAFNKGRAKSRRDTVIDFLTTDIAAKVGVALSPSQLRPGPSQINLASSNTFWRGVVIKQANATDPPPDPEGVELTFGPDQVEG
jgi:hypothetical protein